MKELPVKKESTSGARSAVARYAPWCARPVTNAPLDKETNAKIIERISASQYTDAGRNAPLKTASTN